MHPVRAAMERRDLEAIVATLSADVVLWSPVSAVPFRGREEVSRLFGVLVEEYERWECTSEIAEDDRVVLLFDARIGGREVQGVDVITLDGGGLVAEQRILARPLAAVAAYAQVVAPRLARDGGLRRELLRALTAPLPRLLDVGDRTANRLAGRGRTL